MHLIDLLKKSEMNERGARNQEQNDHIQPSAPPVPQTMVRDEENFLANVPRIDPAVQATLYCEMTDLGFNRYRNNSYRTVD